ncbi:hypothetical protein MTR_5g093750 [Medicago truncatula]|uniref:Uncharacterized protein n=1 Tax=Medicago truncatula TaxID=3880 RepID=G7K8P0_MEDTR|nr:hypothetical protein MTR_5g093750 [Medicago truncatula]
MSDRFDDDIVEAMKELISLWVINPSRQVSHRKTLVQSFGPICFVACSAETATKAQTKASIKAGPRLYLFITRDIKYMVVFIYKDGYDISPGPLNLVRDHMLYLANMTCSSMYVDVFVRRILQNKVERRLQQSGYDTKFTYSDEHSKETLHNRNNVTRDLERKITFRFYLSDLYA